MNVIIQYRLPFPVKGILLLLLWTHVMTFIAAESLGNTRCKYGDESCNVCAINVEKTFRSFQPKDEGGVSKAFKWHFRYSTKYNPAGSKASAILGNSAWDHLLGGFKYHVQGFARTNNDTIPYVMSHSDDNKGGFFFIEREDNGRNSLDKLHRSNNGHPMGVSELGQYVISAEDENVRLFDVRKVGSKQNTLVRVRDFDAGGGIAMAQLADGNYLLVSATPGGRKSSQKHVTSFYLWKGSLTKPSEVKLLSQVAYQQPSHWKGNYEFSDNISLITECTTGTMYTIHTSGDESVTGTRGYWRLSRVDWDGDVPTLTTIVATNQDQDLQSCHLRSAASVHVTPGHKLQFTCHERNVVETFWENSDYFNFRTKVVDYVK